MEWSAAPFERFAAIQRHLRTASRSPSYAAPGGVIGPVAGVDAARAARALQAELARADGEVIAFVPGTAHELVLVALAAGLRLSGPPGLLLLSRPESAPDAFTISSYFRL